MKHKHLDENFRPWQEQNLLLSWVQEGSSSHFQRGMYCIPLCSFSVFFVIIASFVAFLFCFLNSSNPLVSRSFISSVYVTFIASSELSAFFIMKSISFWFFQ